MEQSQQRAVHVISLGGSPRQQGWLDDVPSAGRTLSDVMADVSGLPRDGRWMVCGGEPTLRADLLDVLRAVQGEDPPSLWLRTDGLALVSAPVCQALRRAGVDGVRIPLHSGRSDAHDWLVGLPGAARRVSRAIRAAVASGLAVEVEIALTRPTAPHIEETVALALQLGASRLWIRRVRPLGAAQQQFIAISPRLGQLRGVLEAAMRVAGDARAPLQIAGIPQCVAPGAAAVLCGDDAPGQPCAVCPGAPACTGVAAEYTERFGWAEIWRMTPRQQREEVVVVVHPDESTRAVRMRMLRAAQLQPQRLRLVDVAAHPDALSLLRDALRLSVASVQVSGRITQIASFPETALFRLRALSRVDAAAETPDEVATLRGALQRLPGDVQTAVYGLARTAEDVEAFGAQGVDGVRLLPGGRLDALANTIASHLCPPCLGGTGSTPQPQPQPWKGQRHVDAPTDRHGEWEACPHAERCSAHHRCPGLAKGWNVDGVAALP